MTPVAKELDLCHAQIEDLPPSQSASILSSLETILRERYRIGHTTIQFESYSHQGRCCPEDGLYCQMEIVRAQQRDHTEVVGAHQHQHDHDHEEGSPNLGPSREEHVHG